jgi:hypothetical protein
MNVMSLLAPSAYVWGEVNEPDPEIPEEEKRGPMAPWMIPSLTNVYRPDGPAYLWLRLVPSWGLEPEEFSTNEEGRRPRWLDDGISEDGLQGILSVSRECWVTWGLEHGICPGQPFCVELYPPRWTKSGYEYEEWDCEWNWDIVRVIPKDPMKAGRCWQRYIESYDRNMKRLQRRQEQDREWVERKRVSDPSALYLRWESYFARGQSTYDDMEIPAGVRVCLCSRHTKNLAGQVITSDRMAMGEDDGGDKNKAFENLLTDFAKTGFHEPPTQWDRLRQYPPKPYISERTLRALYKAGGGSFWT